MMKNKALNLLISTVLTASLCLTGIAPFVVSAEEAEYADDYAYEEDVEDDTDYAVDDYASETGTDEYGYEEDYSDDDVNTDDAVYSDDDGWNEYSSDDSAADSEIYDSFYENEEAESVYDNDDTEETDADDEEAVLYDEDEIFDDAYDHLDNENVQSETEQVDTSAGTLTDKSESEIESVAEDAMMEGDDAVSSGLCGDKAFWSITSDETGTVLTISGSGSTYDVDVYNLGTAPWSGSEKQITNVIIEEGITSIGKDLFYKHTNIITVTLPNGLRIIGDEAFDQCENLQSIEIPNSVDTIGSAAFRACTRMSCVTLPNNLTAINGGTFGNCYSLKTIELPNTLSAINRGAFACSGLESITIPDNVIYIGEYAFDSCQGLTSIVIPDGIEELSSYVFNFCNKLEDIRLPEGLKHIGRNALSATALRRLVLPEELLSIDEEGFYNCQKLVNIEVSHTLETIGSRAFQNCLSLKNVTVYESVAALGEDVFSNCRLLSVNCVAASETERYCIQNNIPYRIINTSGICGDVKWRLAGPENDLTLIFEGNGSIPDFEDGQTPWISKKSEITSLIIDDSITGIGTYAFSQLEHLKDSSLSKNLVYIGDNSFENCEELEQIAIYDNVEQLGSYVFRGCKNLSSVSLAESIISIGEGTFDSCDVLTAHCKKESFAYNYCIDHSIPVKAIVDNGTYGESLLWELFAIDGSNYYELLISGEGNAPYNTDDESPWFEYRNKIVNVVFEGKIFSIGKDAFKDHYELKNVNIPSSVESIEAGAFSDCSSLKEIVIPEGVKAIQDCAFTGCDSLENITLPTSVVRLGNQLFDSCISLEKVEIPENVSFIGTFCFANCTKLKQVIYKCNPTCIWRNTFEGCVNLEEVNIPNSVTTIQVNAFSGCEKLKSIEIPEGIDCLNNACFKDCKTLSTVTIPNSVTRINAYAFANCTNLNSVIINENVTKIHATAFDECNNLTIATKKYSAIYEFAVEHSIPVIITGYYLSEKETNISLPPQTYTGKELTPNIKVMLHDVELAKGIDYSLSYERNIKPGNALVRIIGLGEYCGAVNKEFAIEKASLSSASVADVNAVIYSGGQYCPAPAVKLGSKVLQRGVDYSLSYSNNVEPGTATITVSGKGYYTGTKKAYFTIKPISLTKADISNIVSKTYTGKAITQSPVVRNKGINLIFNKDYYLAYKNNVNTGRATIAIKGKGHYGGVAVRYFAINPKPSWIASLSSPKTKQIKITWGKRTQISGYQLEISTNKDFSKPRMQKNVYDPAKLSMTVTVAKAKTKYYIRIRSFKKTSDKTYFSTWSATKTVTTK